LLSVDPEHVLFLENSPVAFLVVDSNEGDSARGDYPKSIPGVVRPLLEWQTQYQPCDNLDN
jgi:lipopolysaccharide transport system ATP-binding protein